MSKLEKLYTRQDALLVEMRALADKDTLTDEEVAKYEAAEKEYDNNEKEIVRLVKLADLESAAKAPENQPYRPKVEAGKNRADDKPWDSFGEQLAAVVDAARPGGSIDSRLSVKAAAGLSGGVPSDGGFLVETDFSTELLKRTYETGILASRCRKIPISTNANGLKINAIDESSRANGSRFGGVQAYWENEADATTSSKPKFRKMELNLNKLMGLCYATDELLSDTTALESVITQAFAEEFAFKVDDAIFRGTGAGQPLGIINSNALVAVAKESGQAADTIVAENIMKMWSRMWARSRQNAIWLINQEDEVQLAQLSLPVGTGGVPVYMPAGGLSQSPYSSLYGRPVVPIEQASALGDVGDIALVDLSQYLLIDKGGINAASSIHVRFLYDENTFRFIYRVSGQPIWSSPLTPYKGASTLSPFVTLAARA